MDRRSAPLAKLTRPRPPPWLQVSQDQSLYLFTLAVGIVMCAHGWNLLRRLSRGPQASRDRLVAAWHFSMHASLPSCRRRVIKPDFPVNTSLIGNGAERNVVRTR